jgi:flagellar FliL protein
VVVLAAGGAGGFYLWTRMAHAADERAAEKDSKKGKKEAKKEAPADEHGAAKDSATDKFSLPHDEDVTNVIELQPFIVNLADIEEARYLRMTVSVGIGGEAGGEEKPNPLFLTRVKNAMLSVLTTKKSTDVLTVEGKQKLREELLQAAQAASEEPEVHAVYITDFIVQL